LFKKKGNHTNRVLDMALVSIVKNRKIHGDPQNTRPLWLIVHIFKTPRLICTIFSTL